MQILLEAIEDLLKDDSLSEEQLEVLNKFKEMFKRLALTDKEILTHINDILSRDLGEPVLDLLSKSKKFYTYALDGKKSDKFIKALYQIGTNTDFRLSLNDDNNIDIDDFLNGNDPIEVVEVYPDIRAKALADKVNVESRLHDKNILKKNVTKKQEDEGQDRVDLEDSSDFTDNKNITTFEQLFADYPNLRIPAGVRLNKNQLRARNSYIRTIAQLALSGDNWGLKVFDDLFKGSNYDWKKEVPSHLPSKDVAEVIVDNIQSDYLTTDDIPFLMDRQFYKSDENDYKQYLRTYRQLRKNLDSTSAIERMKNDGELYAPERKLGLSSDRTKQSITKKDFDKALNSANIEMSQSNRDAMLNALNKLL